MTTRPGPFAAPDSVWCPYHDRRVQSFGREERRGTERSPNRPWHRASPGRVIAGHGRARETTGSCPPKIRSQTDTEITSRPERRTACRRKGISLVHCARFLSGATRERAPNRFASAAASRRAGRAPVAAARVSCHALRDIETIASRGWAARFGSPPDGRPQRTPAGAQT
eukprot:ctg_1818.g304